MNEFVDKRYKTLRELGDGSFGVVFLAEDQSNGLKVAIKKLKMKKAMLFEKMPNFTR